MQSDVSKSKRPENAILPALDVVENAFPANKREQAGVNDVDLRALVCVITGRREHSLYVGLVEGDQAGVDGESYRGQVKVVEQHGQVVVQPSRRREVERQRPSGHAGDGGLLIGRKRLVAEPQLNQQLKVSALQRLLNLFAEMNENGDINHGWLRLIAACEQKQEVKREMLQSCSNRTEKRVATFHKAPQFSFIYLFTSKYKQKLLI